MFLSDITVVILSRGREEILERTMAYWSQQGVKTLVLHNSNFPISAKRVPKNVEYVISNEPYGLRCRKVAEHLQTKLAILSSDDEVYLPSALAEMAARFNESNQLSSIAGATVAIGQYGPIRTSTLCYRNLKGYENTDEDKYKRLQSHFDPNSNWKSGGIYRLMKSSDFLSMMDLFGMISHYKTPYIYEVSGEILVNSFGPTAYIDHVYWIRNWINEQVSHQNWDRKKYFEEWYEDQNMQEEVEEWKSCMSLQVGLSRDLLENILVNIVELRARSEENEKSKLARAHNWIPEYAKYYLRKVFAPDTLPAEKKNIGEQTSLENLTLNILEFNKAIETLIKD